MSGRCGGEEPERPVDVHPRPRVVRRGDRLDEGVEGAGVHVAGLQAHDRGPAVARLEGSGEGSGLDPALVVGRHQLRRAQAEVAQREVDGVVPLGADQDAYAGRAHQTLGRDVPAVAAQHLVAGGGEAGEVRHRAAGDEADGTGLGEAEQIEEPRLGQLLDRRVGGREDPQAAVLVPRTDQPVDGQRGGMRAADHEPEEPATRHRGQPGVAGCRELVDDGPRIRRSLREEAYEPVGDPVAVQPGRDGPVDQGVEPLEGEGMGAVEAGAAVDHLVSVRLQGVTH